MRLRRILPKPIKIEILKFQKVPIGSDGLSLCVKH